jgi:magnesium transporter
MSVEKIAELLKKHRLVEEMVQNQPMRRHDLVKSVVHRQHLVELRQLLANMAAAEIGRALEALALEDAMLLWDQIPSERQHDVHWEIPPELREKLVGAGEPIFADSQTTAFEMIDGRLRPVVINSRKDLDGLMPVWIDVLNASKRERAYIGEFFGLQLPDPDDTTDLEISSRFSVDEEGDLHLHSNFLLDREEESCSVPVVFIVHEDVLFSVRNEELPVFRLQRRRARLQAGLVSDCYDVLVGLYGADVEYSADSLEDIYETLGNVSRQALNEKLTDDQLAAILTGIAREENLNGRIRGNILDTQRALSFLVRSKMFSQEQFSDAKQILHNIDSLNSHTAFLFDKINFLMDATIGFININQNRRINQLTVFGVVFMPINILAGIGGMSEFSMMTDGIPWPIAYGSFAVAMGMVGWATFLLVKHYETRRAKRLAMREAD